MIRRFLLTIRHAYAMWKVLTLPKNYIKGSWNHHTAQELVTLAERELEELKDAVRILACFDPQSQTVHHRRAIQQVESEAADVSAFVAMVADRCKQ